MDEIIDLTNYLIYEFEGIERKILKGKFTAETLSKLFIQEWVPYIECHECGRSDYCKYAKPHPRFPGKMLEIKCGIVVKAISNFVSNTFNLLKDMNSEQIQNYIDGAFYFSNFIYAAELSIANCINDDILEHFKETSPSIFGHVVALREKLNALAGALRTIPKFRVFKGILLVEGSSEKTFLEELRKAHFYWTLEPTVEVYGGKGGKRLKRIGMLVRKYKEQGYKIYIQGDADGKNSDIFQSLINKGYVEKDCTFAFKHDFETAVPAKFLLEALQKTGKLTNIDLEDFKKNIYSKNVSVIKSIKEYYSVDIESIKTKLAKVLGYRFSQVDTSSLPYKSIWEDEDFKKTEFGKFLSFVQRIAWCI